MPSKKESLSIAAAKTLLAIMVVGIGIAAGHLMGKYESDKLIREVPIPCNNGFDCPARMTCDILDTQICIKARHGSNINVTPSLPEYILYKLKTTYREFADRY